jgi:hypothetical protein
MRFRGLRSISFCVYQVDIDEGRRLRVQLLHPRLNATDKVPEIGPPGIASAAYFLFGDNSDRRVDDNKSK